MEDERILRAHDGNLPRNVFLIAEEFRIGSEAVDKIHRPGATVFGSARVLPGDPVYEAAVDIADASPTPASRSSPAERPA